MSRNLLALNTINYIWNHPNSYDHQIQSISKFFGWQLYKRLTKNFIDVNLLPDVKLRCYPDSYSAASVLYCGLYDYNEMNFVLRYLRAKDSFLDIGANVGVYSLLAASKIKQGNVYSFEVLPKNFQRLQENIQLNNLERVKLYQVAVSDRSGAIELNLADGDSMAFITDKTSEKTISVKADTIDNLLCNENLDNLTLAKIDIEGAEILALQGASRLLKNHLPKVWIMEVNGRVSNFEHNKDGVVELLKSYGYQFYNYYAKHNKVNLIDIRQHQGKNVLVIADSAVDFVKQRVKI